MIKIEWPDFTLPPINQYVLPDAEFFYRFREASSREDHNIFFRYPLREHVVQLMTKISHER